MTHPSPARLARRPRRTSVVAALAAVLAVVALLASSPAADARPPQRGAEPTVIAHRGSSGIAPENTLVAVQAAIAQHSDFFEIDVVRTADGELVLFHDRTPARTTNAAEVFPGRQNNPIGSFTLAELRQLDAGSWFAPEFAGEPIPTLRETLRLIRQRIGFLLEVKDPALYPGIERQIVDELRAERGYLNAALRRDRLVVQSFDHASMARLADIAPEIPVGLLTGRRLTTPELQAASTFAAEVNPSRTVVDQSFVDEVQGLGMRMSVYTVNDGREMRRLRNLGVDGIITDYPVVLLDLYRR